MKTKTKTKTKTVKYPQSKATQICARLYNRSEYLYDVPHHSPSARRRDRWQGRVSLLSLNKAIDLLTEMSTCIGNDDQLSINKMLSKYFALASVTGEETDQMLGRTATAIFDKLLANN